MAKSTTTPRYTLSVPATPAESIKEMVIDEKMAAFYLSTMPYDGQRTLREVFVMHLADQMRRGLFESHTEIHIGYVGGQGYLINGRHRLTAVVQSNLPQVFYLRETTYPTMERLAQAYGHIDIGIARSVYDRLRAEGLADRIGLSPTDLNSFASAINYISFGCIGKGTSGGSRVDVENVIDGIVLYQEYAREYFSIKLPAEIRKGFKRQGTVAVALLTLRYCNEAARRRGKDVLTFWQTVASDDNIGIYDPRKFANRHLIMSRMPSGTANGVVVSLGHSARILASCFNAYVTGKEMRQMPKIHNDLAPLTLPGLPPILDWLR